MSTRTARRVLVTGALLAAAITSTTQPASAGSKISVAGLGTSTANAYGGYDYAGSASGSPFSGDFTGTASAADRALPAVGECEAGQANLRLQDSGGQHYDLSSTGQVCAYLLPLGVMQQFTGRWSVVATDMRRLIRRDGIMDIRLMNGQSDV